MLSIGFDIWVAASTKTCTFVGLSITFDSRVGVVEKAVALLSWGCKVILLSCMTDATAAAAGVGGGAAVASAAGRDFHALARRVGSRRAMEA